MDNVALIDGDSFLYRAGFAVEKTRYLVVDEVDLFERRDSAKEAKEVKSKHGVPEIWTRKELGSLEDAVAVLEHMLKEAIDATGYTDSFIYLSPSTGNFRDTLGTIRKYKGNRDNQQRPTYYGDLREHLLTMHHAIIARGEEADDQISWVARKWHKEQRNYCIVGIDKDLKQIPGKHYDWVNKEHFEITEDEARLYYWAQVLAGDPGDNIAGCWGLGPKKAENFLLECDGLGDDVMWPKVVAKYRSSQRLRDCPYANLPAEDVALETARLIRLRQEVNEPLWTPPSQQGKEDEAAARFKAGRHDYTRAERQGG